jgi:hypothetical protein
MGGPPIAIHRLGRKEEAHRAPEGLRSTMEIELEAIAAGMLSGPSGGFQLDSNLITHVAQTTGKLSRSTAFIDLVEVGRPQVPVVRSNRQDMVSRHKDLVCDGDVGPHLATPGAQAPMLVTKVVAARLGDGHGRGNQRGLEVDVALAHLARLLLAGAAVIAGKDAAPRRQMRGTDKGTHACPRA